MSLKVSREGRVLRLTLNRPEKRNALDTDTCCVLADVFDAAQEDVSVGSILIESTGQVFCAGMDLDEVLEPHIAERMLIHERVFTMGVRSVKPIVAAVQGPALGGGVGLVANAHVVVAAQGTSFGLTELRIAMWPFVIFRAVERAMGERRTVELALTTRIFSVQEALTWGLVHEIAPAIEVEDRAWAIASQLAESSAEAVQSGLTFVRSARALSEHEAGRLAHSMRAKAFASADFHEGVIAFKEKRKAVWPSNS
jgi:enoyl-CoA hydratase/carnithine racemase